MDEVAGGAELGRLRKGNFDATFCFLLCDFGATGQVEPREVAVELEATAFCTLFDAPAVVESAEG